MLSKNQLRNISKLSTKKNRQESGLFLAEGEKLVYELLDSGWKANKIYTTVPIQKINHTRIDSNQMKKISHLASASKILGVFHIPKYDSNHQDHQGFSLVLDNVADPGNMGTIIRLCDWFGIKDIICSENSVDCYNPKVIQSSMGSISRVNISYMSFDDVFSKNLNLVVSDIKGTNINEYKFNKNQVIFFGNESNGLSQKVLTEVRNKITIPRYTEKIESLNLASSVSIVLSELKKKITEM